MLFWTAGWSYAFTALLGIWLNARIVFLLFYSGMSYIVFTEEIIEPTLLHIGIFILTGIFISKDYFKEPGEK